MNTRQKEILKIINENQRISVKDLAQMMGCSMVTTRKDLAELEENMLIKKAHGYATRITAMPIEARMADWYEEKKAIGLAAAGLVESGETIMVESGSTVALFAQEVARTKHVTIVTNAIYIVRMIQSIPNVHVELLGGSYSGSGEVTTGPITELCAREYHVDKFFVGMDGYTDDAGFTNTDYTRNATIREMARQANKTIILTPSAKFGTRSVARLFSASEVHTVVTDAGISEEYIDSLHQNHIRVICARPR